MLGIAKCYRMKRVRILIKNNINFVKIVFANAEKVVIFASASEAAICADSEFIGEMAEWSIAAVLKTVDCNRSGGSNPSFSAKKNRNVSFGFFVFRHVASSACISDRKTKK